MNIIFYHSFEDVFKMASIELPNYLTGNGQEAINDDAVIENIEASNEDSEDKQTAPTHSGLSPPSYRPCWARKKQKTFDQ
jgi:hypothetical protein